MRLPSITKDYNTLTLQVIRRQESCATETLKGIRIIKCQVE